MKSQFGIALIIGYFILTASECRKIVEPEPENTPPFAKSENISMLEEGTKSYNESELGSDEDGDELSYKVMSTSNVNAKFENNKLEITGRKNYFGNASVDYQVSDGKDTDIGSIDIVFENVADDPIANAGSDKNGSINQEISLNSSSSHPDSPLSSIVAYQWRLITGNAQLNDSNLQNAKFVANSKGEYEVELKVTDDKGATDSDTVKVNIQSYSLIINATNVLNDAGVGGLEVVLNGQSAITDANGRAEIEFASPNVSGDMLIKDEDVQGVIGDYFNFSDDVNVGSGIEVNVEMVPNLEFNSVPYTSMFDMITQLRGKSEIGRQPGDWPNDYPVLLDFKRDEMLADHYNQAVDEAIQYINDTLGWEVFKETTGDDARYVFDYSRINSSFESNLEQINNIWYINDAIVYIANDLWESNFEILKGIIVHELFTHGLGWKYHSQDSQDISSVPVWDSNITTNERNAKEVNLKLDAGTDLNKYQID